MTENGKEQTKAHLDESHNKLYIVLKCIVEEKVQLFISPLCPLCKSIWLGMVFLAP